MLGLWLATAGCSEPGRTPSAPPKDADPTANSQPGSLAPASTIDKEAAAMPPATWLRLRLELEQEADARRWLRVEALRDEAAGGWARGAFDEDRNRIEVTTKGVRRFSVDTARLPVDWNALVIMRIDGLNSELKRREHPVLHFERDAHGQWVVSE